MSKLNYAANIHSAIDASGLSLSEIARRVHTSVPRIIRWYRGHTSPPAAMLPALAGALGLTVEKLLTHQEAKP